MLVIQVVSVGWKYHKEGVLFLFLAADDSVPTGYFLDSLT